MPEAPQLLSATPALSSQEFQAIGRIVKQHAGVDLHDGKEELVRSRVSRRLRALELPDFRAYLAYLEQHREQELVELLDVVTTNKTHFFREAQHFDFLQRTFCGSPPTAPLRFWSAGCSSGEEPYSLAMLLAEQLPAVHARAVRILATDISRPVLQRAHAARYRLSESTGLEAARVSKHCTREPGDVIEVKPELRAVVRFARLNLMERWPMRGPFHAILCRNVMIYFDRPTRERLVERFRQLLAPGGYLLVGHSESLSGLKHGFDYVAPATYQRP